MIEHIILFGISTLFWSNLFYSFKQNYNVNNYTDYKLLRNKFSSTHAHGSIITCSFGFINKFKLLPIFWSFGYFSYDLYLCLKKLFNKDIKEYKNITFAYVIHHLFSIIAIYFMSYKIYKDIIIKTLLIAELSNLPSYYIYNYIGNNNENSIECKKIKLIQLILYPFIRIIIIGYIIYKNINIIPKILFPGVFLIYSMGLIWSFKLCNKYFKK
mgnify:CR=1 FL=1|jgi:hypothetical protein